MQKLGILSKGITPCEQCGHPSTTMMEAEYLCDDCARELSETLTKESCISRPFQKSMRRMLEELK